MNAPAYFDKDFFQRGQAVQCGEFKGTIVRYYHDGMWEVRLPGGVVCVSGSELKLV